MIFWIKASKSASVPIFPFRTYFKPEFEFFEILALRQFVMQGLVVFLDPDMPPWPWIQPAVFSIHYCFDMRMLKFSHGSSADNFVILHLHNFNTPQLVIVNVPIFA